MTRVMGRADVVVRRLRMMFSKARGERGAEGRPRGVETKGRRGLRREGDYFTIPRPNSQSGARTGICACSGTLRACWGRAGRWAERRASRALARARAARATGRQDTTGQAAPCRAGQGRQGRAQGRARRPTAGDVPHACRVESSAAPQDQGRATTAATSKTCAGTTREQPGVQQRRTVPPCRAVLLSAALRCAALCGGAVPCCVAAAARCFGRARSERAIQTRVTRSITTD